MVDNEGPIFFTNAIGMYDGVGVERMKFQPQDVDVRGLKYRCH